MKTINDFKLIDGIAVLEGVAYIDEAKVVDEFLKNNSKIKYAKVVSKDNRHFKLDNNRLVITEEEKFLNPYYKNTNEFNSILNSTNNEKIYKSLEERVKDLEDKQEKLIQTLVSFIEKIR